MNTFKAASETTVSLIVCTYNREELLVNTLRCALQQDFDNLEIIVIDQTVSHNQSTSCYLESVSGQIKHIILEEPSLTKARNEGIRLSNSDILVFVDDDVLFDKSFVSEHVISHCRYDVVQGRIIEGEVMPARKPLWINKFIKYSGSNNCINEGKINVITGCNFSIKKTVVDKVGYFDEFFSKVALREDSDYGLRCYKTGMAMGFSPKAALKHLKSPRGGVETGISHLFFSESYYTNDLYFAQKHFSTVACFFYKQRMKRRGYKSIRKLLEQARYIIEYYNHKD